MDKSKVDQAFADFKARFPDFKSFSEPGTKFVEQELDYKRELSDAFNDFGKQLLETPGADLFDQFLNLFRALKLKHFNNRVQNLVGFRDVIALADAVDTNSQLRLNMMQHVKDLLQSSQNQEDVSDDVNRLIHYLSENGLQPAQTKVWPSIILFLWRPKEFIFIKPRIFDRVLPILGFEKLGWGKELTAEMYERLMQDMSQLRKHLAAQDYIEVHSFFYEVAQTKEVNGISSNELLRFFQDWRTDTKTEQFVSNYRKLVEFVRKYREKEREVDDELVDQLWLKSDNWFNDLPIDSLLPLATIERNRDDFRTLTENIIRTPAITTYRETFNKLNSFKQDSDDELVSVSRLLVRRAFVAAHPELFVAWLSNRHLKNLAGQLSGKYGRLSLGGSWLENQRLVREYFVSNRIPQDDIVLFNTFPRHLRVLLPSEQNDPETCGVQRNVILYGPPGTGKTFELQNIYIPRYTASTEAVSKREWISEMLDESKTKWWEIIAVVLVELDGNPVSVPQISNHEYIRLRARTTWRKAHMSFEAYLSATLHAQLGIHSPKDSEYVHRSESSKSDPRIFLKDADSRWRLVDNWEEVTEESERLKELAKRLRSGPSKDGSPLKRYEFVTFHQSYSYEEFVEGIRMTLGNDEEDAGETSYELRLGVFRRICGRAQADPDHRYALFIDEINRGNISKIFGELITLIEPDKRMGGDNELEVRLPYSSDEFSVPSNLDIYGTMNTADRSLVSIDTALRRRFQFRELMPQPNLLNTVHFNGEEVDLVQMLQVINQRIEALLDREHMIGHAYFLKDKGEVIEGDELPSIFQDKIIPLLTEYFFDDWSKVRTVLGDDRVEDREELQFIRRSEVPNKIVTKKADLQNPHVYRVNSDALSDANAYVKIYSG